MYFVFVILVFLFYSVVKTLPISEGKKLKRFCLLAFVVIFFLHSFKDDSILPDLDRDGGGYKYEFELICEIDSFKAFLVSYFITGGYFHEIGWALLNFIVSRFTDDFTVFQKVVSIGICAGYSYGIYRLSKNPLFSFFFLMLYPTALFQSFYVLRQHLAQALFFFLVPYIISNDYKKIFLGFVIVISLHYSAVILLPFYIYFRLGDKLFTFKRIVFSVLLIGGYLFLLNNVTYERYADKAVEEKSNTLGLILTGGVFCIYVLFHIINKKKKQIVDKYDSLVKTYMLYSVIICLACIGTSTGRLTNYFTIFLMISVPYSVCYCNKPLRLCAYTVFLFYCLIAALNSDRGLFQYQLFF